MSDEVTSARPTTEGPSPESIATSSARPRPSARRVLYRVLLAFGLLGLAAVGGYLGFRQVLVQQAKNTPMKLFSATTATVGNDVWVDESPSHEVQLDAFSLDRTEVIVRAYRVCMEEGGCTAPASGADCNLTSGERRDDHPINCVTYDQAAAFCAWAGKRLPTEHEWEHAARTERARAKQLFPWGDSEPDATRSNACGAECAKLFGERGEQLSPMHDADDGFPLTAPVASFPKGATSEGLFDMAGNVWEWTKSPHCAYRAKSCDHDDAFVIRGGGYRSNEARTLEVTSRARLPRGDATEAVGFRCARDG